MLVRKTVGNMAALAVVIAAGAAFADHEVPIEDLDTSKATCGWGRVKVNGAVGGGAIHIAGQIKWRGLGVHAPSRVDIPLGGTAKEFKTGVGVDDGAKGGGSVIFRILCDGEERWNSGVMRFGEKEKCKHVDLKGVQTLSLVVDDAGDGKDCDHASWAEARVVYPDGAYPPNSVYGNSRILGVLTPKPGPAPRINGATRYGVRPGRPVLYRVPVTGNRPMDISVEGLPEGLRFDPSISAIVGNAPEKRGDYALVFRAKNAHGAAERKFTLVVGDRIALTPAMGWNSWNCFSGSVTQEKVQSAADAMIASGLADHGWSYIVVDDFWQNNRGRAEADKTLAGPERDEDGAIVSNARFPSMKGMADYIHSKGLKAGLYSSPGPTTCGGCTGSWEHEEQDAKSYADWGFDFLKYDWCSYGSVAMGSGLDRAMYPYLVMGRALRHQKRDILFSLCQYGMENVSAWGALVDGSSWRTTGDVFDTWRSISGAIERQKKLFHYSAPGAWNDPDMLCVGKMNWNQFKGSRLAPNEQYTHISLWALVASPLMIGCDLTQLDEFTFSLLANDEVIDIDQDPLGAGAGCIDEGEDWEIWARPLADGSIAAGLYNKSVKEQTIRFDLEKNGILCKWRIRDVWAQEDVGVFMGSYETSVPGHATQLIRLSPLPCGKLREDLRDIRDNAWRLLRQKDLDAKRK